MKSTDTTREEMWAKQHLSAAHIDYAIWERDKQMTPSDVRNQSELHLCSRCL